jgi:hypothetical protein
MKKILLLSSVVLVAGLFLAGCSRNDAPVNYDENYWLSQERGEVVYSDPYCSYYVVETYYGYTIIRSWGSYRPYEGSIMYGNFGNYGTRDFYNRSSGIIIPGEVVEYDLSYVDAQYAIEYYCPYAKASRIKESATSNNKATRPVTQPGSGTGNE